MKADDVIYEGFEPPDSRQARIKAIKDLKARDKNIKICANLYKFIIYKIRNANANDFEFLKFERIRNKPIFTCYKSQGGDSIRFVYNTIT